MTDLVTYFGFSDLDEELIKQYREAINLAFPDIILNSKITKKYWSRLEQYFPNNQIFMVAPDHQLIGFMNVIPVFWDQPLKLLPDEGWDWLLKKGITDFENNMQPNNLGGLQIIVKSEYQGKGYSKLLIEKAKMAKENLGFKNLIIPIRPILKNKYPKLKMKDYINIIESNKVFDPWIRRHLSSGAEIIKICKNSMNIEGNVDFWEGLLHEKIIMSGSYEVAGALNLVSIDIEKDYGEYREENIWIHYA